MPGRFTQTIQLEVLQNRFGFSPSGITLNPRYNITPRQETPIVVREDRKILKMMRWGLVPFWAKEDSIGDNMINAKAETVTQKPSFKNSFKERRCLVLADGFYEWKDDEKQGSKIPYRFVLKSREPFAFAGLQDEWNNPQGDNLLTFTIITTDANELIKPIHDRMPVILHEKDEGIWLDPQLSDTERLSKLLKPYPSDHMQAYDQRVRFQQF